MVYTLSAYIGKINIIMKWGHCIMTFVVILKGFAVWIISTIVLSLLMSIEIAMGASVFVALISLNFFVEVPESKGNDGDYFGGGGDPGC